MLAPTVLWPAALGVAYFGAGIFTYRRELLTPTPTPTPTPTATAPGVRGLVTLGPTFVAASLAAFAGEHFTAARSLAELVPAWLPARVFIAYLVGAAHLAAATSFVARRCVRWAAISLAVMFALFVLLMDVPAAVTHPGTRLDWILAAREGTFAMGALALFATTLRERRPALASRLTSIARVWAGLVIGFYGIEHLLYPVYSPGVPSTRVTAAWVPLPSEIAYLTGTVLVLCGIAMVFRRYAGPAGALAGWWMALLTVALYVPDLFLARSSSQQVTAINFIFDTLLFSGTLLVVVGAVLSAESRSSAVTESAEPTLSMA